MVPPLWEGTLLLFNHGFFTSYYYYYIPIPHLRAESFHANVTSEGVDACGYILVHQVVLLESVASFEHLAAMITEIRPPIHMYIVHVTDVVFLAASPIRARGTAGNVKYLSSVSVENPVWTVFVGQI